MKTQAKQPQSTLNQLLVKFYMLFFSSKVFSSKFEIQFIFEVIIHEISYLGSGNIEDV